MHTVFTKNSVLKRVLQIITNPGPHKVSTKTSHLKRPNKVHRQKIMMLSVSQYVSRTGCRNPVLPSPNGCIQYPCSDVAPPYDTFTNYVGAATRRQPAPQLLPIPCREREALHIRLARGTVVCLAVILTCWTDWEAAYVPPLFEQYWKIKRGRLHGRSMLPW
jgi:hypothetical protein